MALSATIYNFEIQLANVDAQVYESLSLKLACHPSETAEYLLARVLAYCLEYTEGIAFSKGLSDPDEPAIVVKDLTGALKAWIEVGVPDAARVHKASKASPRVAIYTHKDPGILRKALTGATIHRADKLALFALDRDLLDALTPLLERRTAFDLSVTDGEMYINIAGHTLSGTLEQLTLTDAS